MSEIKYSIQFSAISIIQVLYACLAWAFFAMLGMEIQKRQLQWADTADSCRHGVKPPSAGADPGFRRGCFVQEFRLENRSYPDVQDFSLRM